MKKKKFDAVRMKDEIQHKLMKQTAGLSAQERKRRLKRDLATNPILGPLLENNGPEKKDPAT